MFACVCVCACVSSCVCVCVCVCVCACASVHAHKCKHMKNTGTQIHTMNGLTSTHISRKADSMPTIECEMPEIE